MLGYRQLGIGDARLGYHISWVISATLPAFQEDGLSAVVSATNNLGSVQIKVTADVDLGEGIELITGILDLEIAGNKAVSLGIIAGTPREQAV